MRSKGITLLVLAFSLVFTNCAKQSKTDQQGQEQLAHCFEISQQIHVVWKGEKLTLSTPVRPKGNFLYHLVERDGAFVNRDFAVERFEQKGEVYQVTLALEKEYHDRIVRLGTYLRTEEGIQSLWSQEIDLQLVQSNPLLACP